MLSKKLRDAGIARAIESAENTTPNWSGKAYKFLLEYIKTNKVFMTEDVRLASNIPPPPSERAWGGIIVKAVKEGLIKRKGFRNVKNAKAHCTPASLWEVV